MTSSVCTSCSMCAGACLAMCGWPLVELHAVDADERDGTRHSPLSLASSLSMRIVITANVWNGNGVLDRLEPV